MSGHTSTAGAAAAGCTKYASQVPSGVLIFTSDSVTATAFAARGRRKEKPAPSAIAPSSRRLNAARAL